MVGGRLELRRLANDFPSLRQGAAKRLQIGHVSGRETRPFGGLGTCATVRVGHDFTCGAPEAERRRCPGNAFADLVDEPQLEPGRCDAVIPCARFREISKIDDPFLGW